MFIDEPLLDRYAYGFVSSSTFATTRYQLKSGRSKRNAERSMPLYRFKVPYKNVNVAYAEELIASYNRCQGPIHSFRFKDHSDYTLSDVIIGTAVGGAGETMQIVKPYPFGSSGSLDRIISKPKAGITLTQDDGIGGVTSLSHTIDLLTGIVTFTSTAGYVIRATGEFDVPVHFDDDEMDLDYETWEHLSSDIVLVEDFNA